MVVNTEMEPAEREAEYFLTEPREVTFVVFVSRQSAGKVFVHCAMGLSRSSTLVLAYLMIHENMTLADAIKGVSANRNISPNHGFLEQLRELDKELHGQVSSRSLR